MMKRIIFMILTFVMCLSVAVYAEPEVEQSGQTEVVSDGQQSEAIVEAQQGEATEEAQQGEAAEEFVFKNDSVSDNAGKLTEEEKNALREIFQRIRSEYHIDACLYTDESTSFDDCWYDAQEIYYNNGYGYGESSDGILLYNCPSERQYAIFTYGSGETIFNDVVLDDVEASLLHYLRDEYFFDSYKAFADKCEYYASEAAQGNIHGLDELERRKAAEEEERIKDRNSGLIAVGIFALVIAFIMMKSKLSKMNTAVGSDYAADYMKQGSLNMRNAKDLFLYSHTTSVRIETERSSSSGGGHSGGGGGRSGSY